MLPIHILSIFLLFLSISPLFSQEKKKIFLANLNIGKSDISKEKQMDAIVSESLIDTAEVITERDAYKYMIPASNKKKIPCKTDDSPCIEKEIDPFIKNTQKCLSIKPSNPEICYIPYMKKYDTNLLLLINTKTNTKDLLLQLILLKNSGDSFEKENLFEKNILPFQLGFYLKEAPKFLFNPKYIVKVPKELYYSNEKIDLRGMKIESFKKLDIDIYNFMTNDQVVDAIIEEQKPILKQADSHFLKSEYSRAKNFYLGIIKAIELGLRPSLLPSVSPYIFGLKSRIGLCDINEFIYKINETDSKFTKNEKNVVLEDLQEVMKAYYSLYQQTNSFEYLDTKSREKVHSGLLKRINLLKNPLFSTWEKRAEQLFYQYKYVSTIREYESMISILDSIFPLPNDISYYTDKYLKAIEETKIRGKKILRDFIKTRYMIAERKNINFISQYFVENEKISDIKTYQIISENILNELVDILKDNEYDNYLSNGVKKAYNRVVFQINQSRKNINEPFLGEYAPYFIFRNNFNMEFEYVPVLETFVDCNKSEKNCYTDLNGENKKVVTQKPFYMGKYEITQEVWMEILDLRERDPEKGKIKNPSYFKECGENCPVESISYQDVLVFIKALCKKENFTDFCPYRIPTQSEWELAAKGWDEESYPGMTEIGDPSSVANWGKNCSVTYNGSINLNEIGSESFNPIKKIGNLFTNFDTSSIYPSSTSGYFSGASSKCGTNEVGKKKENFFKLYDMSGNVAEFCEKSNPKELGICGGSWASNQKEELQSKSYLKINQLQKQPTVGFRLVYAPNDP
jgi:formylglycine-generating enzyme required for sulfatase activity